MNLGSEWGVCGIEPDRWWVRRTTGTGGIQYLQDTVEVGDRPHYFEDERSAREAVARWVYAQEPRPVETVNHPAHYNVNPSGVEAIDVIEHLSFNVGNAIKYLWRAGEKGKQLEDLKKAAWYVNREIERLSK